MAVEMMASAAPVAPLIDDADADRVAELEALIAAQLEEIDRVREQSETYQFRTTKAAAETKAFLIQLDALLTSSGKP